MRPGSASHERLASAARRWSDANNNSFSTYDRNYEDKVSGGLQIEGCRECLFRRQRAAVLRPAVVASGLETSHPSFETGEPDVDTAIRQLMGGCWVGLNHFIFFHAGNMDHGCRYR